MRLRQLVRGGRGWGWFSQLGSRSAAWVGLGRRRKKWKMRTRSVVVGGLSLLEEEEEDGEMAFPALGNIISELNEMLATSQSSSQRM